MNLSFEGFRIIAKFGFSFWKFLSWNRVLFENRNELGMQRLYCNCWRSGARGGREGEGYSANSVNNGGLGKWASHATLAFLSTLLITERFYCHWNPPLILVVPSAAWQNGIQNMNSRSRFMNAARFGIVWQFYCHNLISWPRIQDM